MSLQQLAPTLCLICCLGLLCGTAPCQDGYVHHSYDSQGNDIDHCCEFVQCEEDEEVVICLDPFGKDICRPCGPNLELRDRTNSDMAFPCMPHTPCPPGSIPTETRSDSGCQIKCRCDLSRQYYGEDPCDCKELTAPCPDNTRLTIHGCVHKSYNRLPRRNATTTRPAITQPDHKPAYSRKRNNLTTAASDVVPAVPGLNTAEDATPTDRGGLGMVHLLLLVFGILGVIIIVVIIVVIWVRFCKANKQRYSSVILNADPSSDNKDEVLVIPLENIPESQLQTEGVSQASYSPEPPASEEKKRPIGKATCFIRNENVRPNTTQMEPRMQDLQPYSAEMDEPLPSSFSDMNWSILDDRPPFVDQSDRSNDEVVNMGEVTDLSCESDGVGNIQLQGVSSDNDEDTLPKESL